MDAGHEDQGAGPQTESESMSLLRRLQLKHMSPSGGEPEDGQSASDRPRKTTSTGGSDKHLERAQEVITDLKGTLNRAQGLSDSKRLNTWRSAVTSLGEEVSQPTCTIGVVGESGHGKSSLLNALLDHSAILPTSGTRACTAVVIEVRDNESRQLYEARIEFMSEEEWKEELQLLWETLETEPGVICTGQPDANQHPEAHVAWVKVRTVYGDLSSSTTLEDLMEPNEVTKHLGKPIDIAEAEVDTFCDRIAPYVTESDDNEDGGEFWPLVKKVSIRIPECKVCRDGIVLVDLPGARDSNAARDIIAQEYMKKLSHVLYVADILRVVTSKTAKELMGEHFRRQMRMDGQLRNMSFVCTKSDIIGKRREIEQELKHKQKGLCNKMLPDNTAIKNLKADNIDLHRKTQAKDAELKDIKKKEKQLKSELRSVEKDLSDLKEKQFSGAELKQRNDLAAKLEEKCKMTEADLERVRNQQSKLHDAINEYEKEISVLSAKIHGHGQALDLICAKARNDFVQEVIHKDFRSGIKEMMLYDGDETDNDVDEIARTLRVFCVSSMDYQNITSSETEEPRVFKETADTEIPRLQEFLRELGVSKSRHTELLLRRLYLLLSKIKVHLSTSGTQVFELQKPMTRCMTEQLRSVFSQELEQLIQTYSDNLQRLFDILLIKLKEGEKQGKLQALDICSRWGRKPDKSKRTTGGLKHGTYKAVCRRGGAYKSAAVGIINFNDDLATPLYKALTSAWDNVFNVKLGHLLDEFLVDMSAQLEVVTERLEGKFPDEASVLAKCGEQLLHTAEVEMDKKLDDVRRSTVKRQRNINRMISHTIQNKMRETYDKVKRDTGKGSFERMKAVMEKGVENASRKMYNEAAACVKNELTTLQADVGQSLADSVRSLLFELQDLFEQPQWESPTSVTKLKSVLGDDVDRLLNQVKGICEAAKVCPRPRRKAMQMTSGCKPRKRRSLDSQGPPEKRKADNRHHFTGSNDRNPNGQ